MLDALKHLKWPELPWADLGLKIALVLAGATLLYRVVHALVIRVFPDAVLFGHLVRRSYAAMQLAVPLLGTEIVLHLSDDGLQLITPARQFNTLLLITSLTVVACNQVDAFGDWILRRYPLDAPDNLMARRVHTQTRVLTRSVITLLSLLGLSAALMVFPAVRQFGISLLASAGVAGLVVGLAAKPVLGNLLAGLQIALTQPIRLDDVLIVQGEWGRVEEITSTYVVVRIWDERRMIVPLQWFIENPFQNWTRTTANLLGTVFLYVDYGLPLEPLRKEAERLAKDAPEWDGRVCGVQLTDSDAHAMQIRVLLSSVDSGRNFDLRCKLREGLIDFIRRDYPQFLPRLRAALDTPPMQAGEDGRAGSEAVRA
jgi:small-conductance mechanosensitive channel